MTKIWKKSLLTLGGIATVTIPVVTVVSCSKEEDDVSGHFSIHVFRTREPNLKWKYWEVRKYVIDRGGGAVAVPIDKIEYDYRMKK